MFKRAGMLAAMMRNLETQIVSCMAQDIVEICCNIDNGEKTTGQKRNELIESANGKYISFIDDDDYVYPCYVAEILSAISGDPDVVAINGFITTNGGNMKRWFISKDLNYAALIDESGLEVYHRYPNHLAPIKKNIAVQVKFPHQYVGEDFAYATELHNRKLIKTEATITTPIYLYKFNSLK